MGNKPSIDYFVKQLETPNGSLREAREDLALPPNQKFKLTAEQLGCKNKVYKVKMEPIDAELGQVDDFVVKFNPRGSRDLYTDNVHKEYDILKRLHPSVKVAKPIHCSNEEEEKAVGTQFIIMGYVEGTVYADVGKVPPDQLQQALKSVMETLADLHAIHWHPVHDARLFLPHENTQSFWKEEVKTWMNNYQGTIWWWQWKLGSFPESYFYSDMLEAGKPTSNRVCCIHRNLTISNFVFDDNMTVKAILNFKYDANGDPLMDIASILMVFSKSGDYSASGLTVRDEEGALEDMAKEAYHGSRRKGHRIMDQDLSYAKAVCCLRDIYRIKEASNAGFKGNELGRYGEITANPRKPIEILHYCGGKYLEQSSTKE